MRVIILLKERLCVGGLTVSDCKIAGTHLLTRTSDPAFLLFLFPPQIPVLSNPFKRNVEQIILGLCRFPGQGNLRRGAQLKVRDVSWEDVETVKDVGGVWASKR